MRWLAISCVLLASCGAEPVEQGEWSQMSDYPPDGYDVTGSGVTWAGDFTLIPGIGQITAVTNPGGGDIRIIASAAIDLVVGQYVRIEGTTNYDGEYAITATTSASFDVTATYVSTDTGTFYTNVCGEDSIRFEDNTPAGDPTYIYDTSIAIEIGKPLRMSALVQASSVAAGNTVLVGVRWYDADDGYLETSTVHNAVLPATGGWYRLAGIVDPPVGAVGARPIVQKANNAFYIWQDDIALEELDVSFSAYRNSTAQTLLNNTVMKVEFDGEAYDYGSVYDSSSSYQFTAPQGGTYLFVTRVQIFPAGGTFNGGGSTAALYFTVNGSIYTMIDHQPIPSGGSYLMLQGTEPIPLSLGDTVEVSAFHNDGGSPSINVQPITSSTYRSTFSGVLQ